MTGYNAPLLLLIGIMLALALVFEIRRSRLWHDSMHKTKDGFLCDRCLARFLSARRERLDTMYREHRKRMDKIRARHRP